MRNNKLQSSIIALLVLLVFLFTPIQIFARDIPLQEVEEIAATTIPNLLSVNNISNESNEYELQNYIPEYIYSTSGLIERPVVYFPVYSNGSVIAKIAGFYDSNYNEYSYCSTLKSVEILNMSTQYFSKGVFIDMNDDCFYTDGTTFVSMTSGTILTINDFDEDCQNILNNFFSTFEWARLSLHNSGGIQSVNKVEGNASNEVFINLPHYNQGNKPICWAAAAWTVGSYLTKSKTPSPEQIAIEIKGTLDSGGSAIDEIAAMRKFYYSQTNFSVDAINVVGLPATLLKQHIDLGFPCIVRLSPVTVDGLENGTKTKKLGHSIAVCGYSYEDSIKLIYVQDTAFDRMNVLTRGPLGAFRYIEEGMPVLDLSSTNLLNGYQSPDSGVTWYQFVNGVAEKCFGWRDISGSRYHFSNESHLQRGWLHESEGWYYLAPTGVMQKGWVFVDGKWYFLQDNGLMAYSQWFKWNGVWYYLNSDGSAQTGWKEIEGSYYFFNDSAKMQTGWVNDRGYWFYLDSSGKMLTGFQTINGYKYYFADNGSMALGWFRVGYPWYYADSNGVIQTGWQYIKGEWYYFNYTGTMHLGRLIDGGYIFHLDESSGAMQIGWFTTLEGKFFFRTEKNVPYGGPKGSMIVGQKARIDGVVYEFDQKGIARKVLNPNIIPVSVPTTDLSEVTDDAA